MYENTTCNTVSMYLTTVEMTYKNDRLQFITLIVVKRNYKFFCVLSITVPV